MVKGYSQRKGIDYAEYIFSCCEVNLYLNSVEYCCIGEFASRANGCKNNIFTWRSGKEIYMHQPEGFVVPGKEHMVCKLTRRLYGLKYAQRKWYKKFDSFITKSGFYKAEKDPCCYFKKCTDSYVFLLLYVDDMLIAGSCLREINNIKIRFSAAFEMNDLGHAKQILGMRISRDRSAGTLNLSQEFYMRRC